MQKQDRWCTECGSRLSRYNPDPVCASCTRTQQLEAELRPLVPEEFWQNPDVRTAIAGGDFGRLSLLVRRLAGLRQADMAFRTGLSQSFLSLLEQGRRRLTRLDNVAQFLAGIGTPDALIPGPLHDQVRAELAAGGNRPALPPRNTERAHSRSRGASHLTADAAFQALRFMEEMAATNVTDLELADLESQVAQQATQYVHTPLRDLFTDMVGTRDQLFRLLKGRQFPRQTQRLYLLAGASSLLLAHASQNLGDEEAALIQLQTAWTLAEHTDSDDLRAWVKGTVALIAEWSTDQQVALEYTQQATQFATGAETRARIAAIEARTAARIGDRNRALQALDDLHRARDLTSRTDELGRFGGILTFPEAKQEYYIGGTYALLGEHTLAEQHSIKALDLYQSGPPNQRSYGDEALARLNIATGRIAAGDTEGAEEQLHILFALPEEQRIRQLADAMDGVAALLESPRCSRSPLARELADAARSYMSPRKRTKVINP